MINLKENLATSAFNSIYGWLGHWEGKIIAPLMGQLFSMKLPFEYFKKNISRSEELSVIIKSSDKHSQFSNNQIQ